MPQTILVADDELQLLNTVRAYLENSGYQVVTALNGKEALQAFRREAPDAVILDVMMPEMDGFEVARQIRKDSMVPILMLTARADEFDQALGLELGADDYVTKPFSPRVLVARVRAILRRSSGGQPATEDVLQVGAINLNKQTRIVTVEGIAIDLTRSEFDLLAALMAHPRRVFTRMDLLEQMHGEAFAAYERTVDVHVKNLRSKLNRDVIETVYGVGYRMVVDE
ncbi:MAG: response regulator transcription factor [Anaerolineales bacterium]|nr:response regulator transcription factor [Anaerolineales bacterium]